MSPLDSFLFLGVTVAFLWVMWLVLNIVFDAIEDYHEWWREQRRVQPAAEEAGEPTEGKAL